MSRKLISSGSEFEEKAAYSRAVVVGDDVFVAGTTGMNYATGVLAKGAAAQAEQTLRNIAAALEEAGSSFDDVVRVNYVLPDRRDFEACWPAIREAFGTARPAATMIEAGLIDPDMKIEIEVTARRQRS